VSILEGVRCAAWAYHEETGGQLTEIVLPMEDFIWLIDEVCSRTRGRVNPYEGSRHIVIDDVVVRCGS
jgi:hypothetical protein